MLWLLLNLVNNSHNYHIFVFMASIYLPNSKEPLIFVAKFLSMEFVGRKEELTR
jgi:hypothetical protein